MPVRTSLIPSHRRVTHCVIVSPASSASACHFLRLFSVILMDTVLILLSPMPRTYYNCATWRKRTLRIRPTRSLDSSIRRRYTAPTMTNHHALIHHAIPCRVLTVCGVGTATSITREGWVAVRLDGETRRDEYPVETVRISTAEVAR